MTHEANNLQYSATQMARQLRAIILLSNEIGLRRTVNAIRVAIVRGPHGRSPLGPFFRARIECPSEGSFPLKALIRKATVRMYVRSHIRITQ